MTRHERSGATLTAIQQERLRALLDLLADPDLLAGLQAVVASSVADGAGPSATRVVGTGKLRAPTSSAEQDRLDALRRDGYLSVESAVAYIGAPSRWAFYKWVKRAKVRTFRRGRCLLVRRRDLDEALKTPEERGTRHFFASAPRRPR